MNSTQLIEALAAAAKYTPDRGIGIYDRRGQNVERRSYREIAEMARNRAERFAGAGVKPGDRIMLGLSTSWDLLELLFGALTIGAYPVMVSPPGALGSAGTYGAKIIGQCELLTPRLLVVDASSRDLLRGNAELERHGARPVTAAELAATTPGSLKVHAPTPADIAFLQLTSGSTGKQRAVQVTHASAIHNAHAMADFVGELEPSNSVVSWLPLNHDMGLVGCLLFSLVNGLDCWLLRPETFLARPSTWLKTISTRRGSLTPAPNFAFQLCVDRIEPAELAGCDLSSIRSAVSGAEMIRPETCAAFVEKFGPFGFRAEQWQSSYGMAECTLAATCDRVRSGIRTEKLPERADSIDGSIALGSDIVCTGRAVMDTTVKISSTVKPGEFLPDFGIGEIWVKGPSVFSGYYNNPQATADALVNGWLRTGDLGFMKNGELYITGRLKDLLIIHGENWMPHELEWEAEGVIGSSGAERSGAFSVDVPNEGERPVIVAECAAGDTRPIAELEHAIRSRIGRTLGLPLADVVLVRRGQIPKTTSGKVQRSELRRRYIDGKLDRLR